MLYKALLGIILILNVGCLFEKATFIKSISDVNELHKKLISEGKKSLILIYKVRYLEIRLCNPKTASCWVL